MPLKLLPDNLHIPFTRWRHPPMIASALLFVGSIVAIATMGFNFGIDFRGGITIEVAREEPIDVGAVRTAVTALDLGEVMVQEIQDFAGSDEAVVVYVERQQAAEGEDDDELAQQNASTVVQATLRELLGDDIDFRKIDVVGPTVSGELIQRGAIAVFLAMSAMLLYIWVRFEWQFSLGSIVGLIHDVVLTLGMFAVFKLQFNLAVIAALLTIVGYSMNDTVIVYDRIRENLRKFKKKQLPELIDQSINETLSRTIITSLTTLMTLVVLYVFGGEVLRGFIFAMIWGIIIGTYSTIFVASPFLLATGVKRDWSKQGAPATP